MNDHLEPIHAWVFNPQNSMLKTQKNAKATCSVISCSRKDQCDLRLNCNHCIYQKPGIQCPFGKKTISNGFTKRARNYYTWIKQQEDKHRNLLKQLTPGSYPERIFKISDHWFLPYAHMVKGIWGERMPLTSHFIPNKDMTTELLKRIVSARPHATLGGEISAYQHDIVPKFLSDLKTYYPDLFDLLDEQTKSRIATISYVGRIADITTCSPGLYFFKKEKWQWDGTSLSRNSAPMFAPCKGEWSQTCVPETGQPVTITDNAQVTEKTKFLD